MGRGAGPRIGRVGSSSRRLIQNRAINSENQYTALGVQTSPTYGNKAPDNSAGASDVKETMRHQLSYGAGHGRLTAGRGTGSAFGSFALIALLFAIGHVAAELVTGYSLEIRYHIAGLAPANTLIRSKSLSTSGSASVWRKRLWHLVREWSFSAR